MNFIIVYDTKEEVMRWMLDIQLGRRNLSPIQRIAVAEKHRPIYEKLSLYMEESCCMYCSVKMVHGLMPEHYIRNWELVKIMLIGLKIE